MSGPRMPTARDVVQAAERIAGRVHPTRLAHSAELDRALDRPVLLKCENEQYGGAFKARGACNAVLAADPSRIRAGVATHSSGNHAAALAHAARLAGIPATVVMPRNAARVKREAAEAAGARVVSCAPTQQAREATLEAVVAESGAAVIHPYADPDVIAGQGTVGLELLDELRDGDTVVVPLGGGGLISGISLLLADRAPGVRVIGVEPAGADDGLRSFRAGRVVPVTPDTIADGLRATIGALNLEIIRRHVADIVTVPDAAILEALGQVEQYHKMPLEPSGVVGVAAVATGAIAGRGRVLIVITGGNHDPATSDPGSSPGPGSGAPRGPGVVQ